MNKVWPVKKLGDVTESISTGPFGTMLHKSDYVVDGIPLVNPVNIVDGRIVPSEKMMISNETRKRLSNYVLRTGDVVVGRRGELGRCAIVSDVEEGWLCGTGSCFIRLSKQVDERFFALLFRSSQIRSLLEEASVGTTMSNLNHGILNNLPVPVPPLAEQQRIVGLLDEAIEGLATAKANAEKNLQNASAIFESHLQSVFTQRNNRCVAGRLGDFVQDISTGPFGSLLHKSDYEHGEIPLVNPINIEGDAIIPDERKAVGIATAKRLARYALKENDIVIGRRGEIGRCAVVSREQAGWLCGTGCFVIRPSDKTDPHFLTHLLRSRPYRGLLESVAGRATMPSISNNDLANLVVVLPPIAQQRKTLSLLDRLSEETQCLARIYQQKIVALVALKKSLLHQAFSGQL